MRPVLEYALELALRSQVEGQQISWVRLLCTLPGLSHLLGGQVERIVSLLVGENGAERLRDLVDSSLHLDPVALSTRLPAGNDLEDAYGLD